LGLDAFEIVSHYIFVCLMGGGNGTPKKIVE
jgi:hypothetical protein